MKAMPPPTGQPPMLLNVDYSTDQAALPESVQEVARYADGTLRIESSLMDRSQGIAAAQIVISDAVIQASVSLAEGTDDDLYGIFVRSASAELYYAFAVSPSGHVFVACYDNQFLPLASGPLDPDLPFGHGVGVPNRFQVVAVGPSLTFILNGNLITAEVVDERYREGYLGFFVHHGMTSPRAELAAEWIQVRGLFPSR